MQTGTKIFEKGHPLTTGVVVGHSPANDGWVLVHWDQTPEKSVHSVPASRLRVL